MSCEVLMNTQMCGGKTQVCKRCGGKACEHCRCIIYVTEKGRKVWICNDCKEDGL